MTWIEFLPTPTGDGRIILRGVIVPWRKRLRKLIAR
jgi:hypothetical protein